jgi:hypothetical protein
VIRSLTGLELSQLEIDCLRLRLRRRALELEVQVQDGLGLTRKRMRLGQLVDVLLAKRIHVAAGTRAIDQTRHHYKGTAALRR